MPRAWPWTTASSLRSARRTCAVLSRAAKYLPLCDRGARDGDLDVLAEFAWLCERLDHCTPMFAPECCG
jgi:hypothetical protein